MNRTWEEMFMFSLKRKPRTLLQMWVQRLDGSHAAVYV